MVDLNESYLPQWMKAIRKTSSQLLPNVPVQPKNGMIRTYANESRTFSRPYSAKTVFFYKEGDEYFTGVRLPISKSRYRTIDSLLDDLNKSIHMPFGVRRLTTPLGRTHIEEIDQLEHLGKYVASSSSSKGRGINLSALEKLKKAREEAQESQRRLRTGGQSYWLAGSPTLKQKLRMSRALGLNLPSKQVFFVLNGKGKFYRTLLNQLKLPTMEQLLSEVSEGLEIAIFSLHTIQGTRLTNVVDILALNPPKVIACPRNEKPLIRSDVQLPHINLNRYAPKTNYGYNTDSSITSNNTNSSVSDNGIEKQPPAPRRFNTALKRNLRKTTGIQRHKSIPAYGKEQGSISLLPGETRIPALGQKRPTAKKQKTVEAIGVAGTSEEAASSFKTKSTTSDDSGNFNSASSRQTELLEDEVHAGTSAAPLNHNNHSIASSRKSSDAAFPYNQRKLSIVVQSPSILPEEDEDRERKSELGQAILTPAEGTSQQQHNQKDLKKLQDPEKQKRRERSIERKEKPEKRRSRKTDDEGASKEKKLKKLNSESDRSRSKSRPSKSISKESTKETLDENKPQNKNVKRKSKKSPVKASKSLDKKEVKEPKKLKSKKKLSMRKSAEIITTNDNESIESGIDEPLPSGSSPVQIQVPNIHVSANSRPGTPHPVKDGVVGEEDQERDNNDESKARSSDLEEELPTELSSESENETDEPTERIRKASLKKQRSIVATDEELHKAATTIQAAFRGYTTRKKMKVQFQDKNSVVGESTLDGMGDDAQYLEMQHIDNELESPLPENAKDGKMTYNISVVTGNRWAAETETDLYIVLQGDAGTSGRIHLRQQAGGWLQADEPKFRQNQTDIFHVDTPQLGTLNKLTVGHQQKGYGAGIFIDSILVTENTFEGRQFLFCCNKWLDSGQVDGKIERQLPLSAFYYLNSMPADEALTQGRWEFVIHAGLEDGEGGTTSNVMFVGYGTKGVSRTLITNDPTLQNVPGTSLIQVDFGNIGDLMKLRLEIDGEGEKPDFYIEYIEMRDLDTDERCVVRVGKWLDYTGMRSKKPQPFREFPVFRAGQASWQMTTYEGRIVSGDVRFLEEMSLRGQLLGELSDTGIFPMFYNHDREEFTFKVDCVKMGRVMAIRLLGDFSQDGEGILEGFSVLQDIYDKHQLGISVADELLGVLAYVRETQHCPYRYVLGMGRVSEIEEYNGLTCKILNLSAMEGMSTRNKRAPSMESHEQNWILSMLISPPENAIVPEVELCVGLDAYKMQPISDKPVDGILSYKLKSKPIGLIEKVRVGVGQIPDSEKIFIKKMRLYNSTTSTENRFYVRTDLKDCQVIELTAVYPDVPPKLSIPYPVVINIIDCSGTFRPYVNLIGEQSDSGFRAYPGKLAVLEKKEANLQMEIEALSLGTLKAVEVYLEADKKEKIKCTLEISIAEEEQEEIKTRKITITHPNKTEKLELHLKS